MPRPMLKQSDFVYVSYHEVRSIHQLQLDQTGFDNKW